MKNLHFHILQQEKQCDFHIVHVTVDGRTMYKLECSKSSETVSDVHNRKKLQVASLVRVGAGEQELCHNGKKFLHLKYALSRRVVIL